MAKFIKNFQMDWCLVWDTVYKGSIASAIHVMMSSVFYIGLSLAVIYHSYYFSGPNSLQLANEYREVIRHGDELFSAGHEGDDGEEGVHTFYDARNWLRNRKSTQNPLSQLMQQMQGSYYGADAEKDSSDEHSTMEPLLSEEQRDLLAVPSYAMLIFSAVNLAVSALLIIAINMKNVFFLLLWSLVFLPMIIISDNLYQVFLFYQLLKMEPIWAHTGTVWFEIIVVLNFILWISRNLCNLYTFFCITAFRNASTQRRQNIESWAMMRRRSAAMLTGVPPLHGSLRKDSVSSLDGKQRGSYLPSLSATTVEAVLAQNGLLRQQSQTDHQRPQARTTMRFGSQQTTSYLPNNEYNNCASAV